MSLCGHSALFSATWPSVGMTRNGVAYEQPTWAPPTAATGSSSSPGDEILLPTPDTGLSPNGHGRRGGKLGNGKQSGASLDAIATTLLPTPRATDTGTPGRRASEGFRPPLSQVINEALLPTPTATPYGNNQSDSPGAAVRPSLDSLARNALLPTPTASDTNGTGTHGTGGPDLRTTVSLLPTPQARDGDGRGASHPARRKELQPKQAGQLDEVAVHLLGPLLPTPTVHGNNNVRGMSPTSQDGLTTVLRALPDGESTSPASEAGNTP